MPTKSVIATSRRPTKRSDPRALRRFVEELSWLLTTFDDLDFRALSTLVSEGGLIKQPRGNTAKSRKDETANLLGRLPSLFMDEALFPSNEDIVEFARHALEIDMPRWHKKSKYELIGNVVCNANLLDVGRLRQLISAVERLQDSKGDARDFVTSQRKMGLSWNEVIQSMLASAY